jgi:hypothetical protein
MTTQKPSIVFDDTPVPVAIQPKPIDGLLPPVHKSILITNDLAIAYSRTPTAILQALRQQAARQGYVLRTQSRTAMQHNETGLRVWTVEDPTKYEAK